MSKPKFWVTCPDFTKGPYTDREAAQTAADKYNSGNFGGCTYDHEVTESDVKPEPANSAWLEDDTIYEDQD